MAVFGRGFARAQILDRGPKGGADIGVGRQARIGQPDRPAFAPASHRHQMARGFGQRQQARPFPQMRQGPGFGMHGHQVADLRPQGDQVFRREPLIKRAQFGAVVGLHGVFDGVMRAVIHGEAPLGWARFRRAGRSGILCGQARRFPPRRHRPAPAGPPRRGCRS